MGVVAVAAAPIAIVPIAAVPIAIVPVAAVPAIGVAGRVVMAGRDQEPEGKDGGEPAEGLQARCHIILHFARAEATS
jgi:hypothetical protein